MGYVASIWEKPQIYQRYQCCREWRLALATLNYRELAAPIRRGRYRCNGLRGQRSVDKLPDGPSAIDNAQRLRWRRLEGFVDTAEIVMRDIQRDRRNVVVDLL